MGIALATAISAWVNAILLFLILIGKKLLNLDRQFMNNIFKLFVCLVGLVLVTRYLNSFFFAELYLLEIMKNIIYLVLTIMITAAFYVVLILILKIVTIADIKNYLKR